MPQASQTTTVSSASVIPDSASSSASQVSVTLVAAAAPGMQMLSSKPMIAAVPRAWNSKALNFTCPTKHHWAEEDTIFCDMLNRGHFNEAGAINVMRNTDIMKFYDFPDAISMKAKLDKIVADFLVYGDLKT